MTDLLNTGIYYYPELFAKEDEVEEGEEEIYNKEYFTEEDITDKHKEWFFKYFNNFNDTEDEEFNKELNNFIEKIIEDKESKLKFMLLKKKITRLNPIGFKGIPYNEKLVSLINYLEKNKIKLSENKIVENIKLERDKLDIELFINKNVEEQKNNNKNYQIFFKKYEQLKIIIDSLYNNYNNKVENIYNKDFYDFFEDDDNFEIYFTINDLIGTDITFLKKILDILFFNKFEKIIYIHEDDNKELLDENPFKNFYSRDNRVIKYYNTFNFYLYESVENWLKNQTISKKFKENKNFIKFLEIITNYVNLNYVLFNFKNDYEEEEEEDDDDDEGDDDEDDDEEDDDDYDDDDEDDDYDDDYDDEGDDDEDDDEEDDDDYDDDEEDDDYDDDYDDDDDEDEKNFNNLKKVKIILNHFNKNNFLIINKQKIEVNDNDKINIYKNTVNKINYYINHEINKEEDKLKEIKIKNINDFIKYILPLIIQNKNNIDLNLLMYFINNPKNNENIISGLINKYKDI